MGTDWMDSGERLVPDRQPGEVIEAEHLVRYRLAVGHVAGLDVLDAGCGVGWGSRLLLREGGARSVVGVDLFGPALEYARQRYPGPDYRVGDMAALPLEDASVDVVTCLEALEHVHDHHVVLAEFRRVLRPGGWILVSSPNPDVYPAGNAYHVHELRPEELVTTVRDTFRNHALLAQELLIASLVSRSDGPSSPVMPIRLHNDDAATDQYGIVVAGDGELPDIGVGLVLAATDQLTHLDAASIALQAERERFNAQAESVAREQSRLERTASAARDHAQMLTERIRDLESRLVAAGEALAAVMQERDDVVERLGTLTEQGEDREDPQGVGPEAGAELDLMRLQRDRALVALLRAEQRTAAAARDSSRCADESDALKAVTCALAAELKGIRESRSWRVTAPLRALRDAPSGMRERIVRR